MTDSKPVLKLKRPRAQSRADARAHSLGDARVQTRSAARAQLTANARPQPAADEPPRSRTDQPRRGHADERGRQRQVLKRPALRGKAGGTVASPLRKATDQEDRLLQALRRQSPETWDPERPRPLAVGIHAQIFPLAEPLGISRSAVRRFLTRWTSRPAYLDALSQPGAVRYDVDGEASVAVEQRHGRRARRRLEAPGRDQAVTPSAEPPQARELPPTRESSPSRQ